MSVPKWKSLQKSADRARKSADHEQAVELYSQALSLKAVPWEATVELTLAYAYCLRMLGKLSLADNYLTGLAEKAEERGDDAAMIKASTELLLILRMSGDFKRALQLGTDALNAAERSGLPGLKADALLALGIIHGDLGNYQAVHECLTEAQPLIGPEDKLNQIKALFGKSGLLARTGKYQDAEPYLKQELDLARSIGDRDWEGIALNQMAIFTLDMSSRRGLYEKALEAFKAAGDRPYQVRVLTNSGEDWNIVGLFQRAFELAQHAFELSRAMGQEIECMSSLGDMAFAAFGMGDLPAAISYLKESLWLAQKTGAARAEYYHQLNLSGCYTLLDKPDEAFKAIHAAEIIPIQQNPEDQVTILVLRAIAHVLVGDQKQARNYASQALPILAELVNRNINGEIIYLSCYRSLLPSKGANRNGKKISQKAWQALELGVKKILNPIEQLSDAGLMRGYLHRDPFRKALILEWLKHAPYSDTQTDVIAAYGTLVQKPGRLDEVFHRLFKVGIRLNAERDPVLLPDEIIEEIDELTGAERIALVLVNEQGKHRKTMTHLPRQPYWLTMSTDELTPDPDAFLEEIEPWLQEVITSKQGYIRYINPEAGLIEQRSLLVTPLISQGKLIGAIYCDIRGCFGRFDPEDLNLLGVLANQSAVALENTEWSATLEQRVNDRTTELKQSNDRLEQRNAELAVINTVQAALAAELDIQGIYDAVGDKISEIFHTGNVSIRMYDPQTNLLSFPYTNEKGMRLTMETIPLPDKGFSAHVIQTRETIVINENLEEISEKYGSYTLPGTLVDKSILFVPLVVGDQARGLVYLSDFEREHAYSDSDVRLLQTLVNSMSVALENARLFDETQRLFAAEQERVAELQIINSIQQGLAAELDFQAIVDLVGDKLREVLGTGEMGINWYDEKTNLLHTLYSYEHGKRLTIEPRPPVPNGVFEQMRISRHPMIANKSADFESVTVHIEGTDYAKSDIAVPIISSDRVLGLINISNYEREYAFGDSEQRLLTTIAASLGTALENARLFDETQRLLKETEQRNAELAVINTVQAALAAELDIQGIYDAVGDKIREIFKSDNLVILSYDRKTNVVTGPYWYENGKRLSTGPIKYAEGTFPPGFGGYVLRTGETLVVNENLAQAMEKYGSYVIPGTLAEKSSVHVPMLVGNEVRGFVKLLDFKREHAFSDSDVRLLETLVNSMSVALENARLFDETQRLVKSEQERVAELEIINSIQQGLAKELDFQAIVDLVGDKLREVFKTGELTISWWDKKANLVHYLYLYEHGKRLIVPPNPPTPGGIYETEMKTRQPYVMDFESTKKYPTIPGTDSSLSSVNIPIISGDRFLGDIAVENFERENAFGETEIRLLTTIAASLGTALENARLFSETQRLFAAEQERVAELQIINSIQQGLAAELDFQAIVDLVGDKLREVFHSSDMMIAWYDEKTNLAHYLYNYVNGNRITIEPRHPAPGGLLEQFSRSRQPKVWRTSDESSLTPSMEGTGTSKSGVAVPIISSDQIVGSLQLFDMEREFAYGESELRLLTTIAASLGTALENARLFDETQQRNSELAVINSVQAALAAELNIQGIYDAVGDKIREIFHSDNINIRIYDPKANLELIPYIFENGKRIWIDPIEITEENKSIGFTGHVLNTRETLVINENMGEAMEKYGSYVLPGTQHEKSAIFVPLIVGDQARGLVNLSNLEREHAFTDSDVRLLETLVNSMSVALENARLFTETQHLLAETEQRNSELAIINSVQAALAAELNIQGIYDAVGDKIREIFHSDNLEIRVFDLRTNMEHFPYLYEKGERIEPEPLPRIDTGIGAHVARTRETLVINENTLQEAEKYGSYLMPGTGSPKSVVYVPLIVGDQVRGLVGLSDFEREHAFSESDVRLLQTLVNSMSVALENARLFDETQRLVKSEQERVAELEIINSIQQGLAKELDFQAIVDLVGDKLREVFKTPDLIITWYEEKTNLLHYMYAFEHNQRLALPDSAPTEKGTFKRIVQTHEKVVWNTAEEGDQLTGGVVPGTDRSKSGVMVPIISSDRILGLVQIENYKQEYAFGETELRLLTTIAASLGSALENARLFDETQRLLKETEQRANELSIINHVSEAMSRQLQVKAIVRTVGDQVRDTLHSEVVNIYLFDEANKMIHLPYSFDRKYVETESFPYGAGLTSKVLESKVPMILGSFEDIVSAGALLNPNAPDDELMPQSYLGVPIIVGEKAVGVIDVQSYTQCVYDDSHVRLLSTLASSMGVALENARLFEETRRLLAETEQRNRELAIISRIGQALAGQLDPQGIFELVGAELQQVFDAQMVGIITYDRLENMVYWRYSVEKGERQSVAPHQPGGFSGHILQTREPLLINHDIAQRAEEYGSTVLAGELPKSYLGVPLIAGGEVTGVITLQNIDREGAFSENDLRLLSTLALNMGVALENARLYQETQHHAEEMAALAEIGSDIASTHEMEPVLERLATKTRELMKVRDIALYLLQPDGHILKPIVSQGKYAEETKAQIITLGYGLTGNVAKSGLAEIVNYPERDPRAVHIEGTPTEEDDLECIMLAPLISRGRVIGVMSVYRDRLQGFFTQLELDFLMSLARQAAIAIESARLYAETERRATEMAALAEVSREISATLELQVVLDRIAGQARELLDAETSAVYLLQPDEVTIKAIAAEGDIAQEVLADEVTIGSGIIGNIVKNGIAERIDDTLKDPRGVHIPGTEETDEGEKLLVAPLLIQERAIGALAAWRDPGNAPFNQAELSFAIGLAQQAVVAIENARLFESAQESQRRMADIIDFLPDATFVVDREGKVIAWNHAIEEMTGVKAADIIGKGNYEYALSFYGERRPILIDLVLVPDEEVETKYSQIQRHDDILMGEAISLVRGRVMYLNATASALKNSRGEAVGAIESIRDVTEQKQAESELHQAKVEAEAANQAKSAFLAMMSHEIRTPMNAIIGMSGLLMDTQLNPDQREFAETIRSSGDSLLTIINDILDFSKIEAGKMTLEVMPFDLRECVETSLDLVKVKASEKGLELAYQIDPGVSPAILGDVTRLRQVLINLLGNSVKFTEQGEIVLTVMKGEETGSLHFMVRDTGIGIPPDRIGLLFKAFTQADTSTSRRYGGTGLGLALSNRIVELMGGKIWVESEGVPGKGSTFHFTIAAVPAPDWRGRPHMEGEHPQLRGKRLLIVDDNATNRRILVLQTQAWGMQPKDCATPFEALETLRQGESFDLAIVDLQMPGMSGPELAGEIRKLEAGKPGEKRMALVLSTSLGGREEARESIEFAAILPKPIRQSALFDLLMTLFADQPKVTPEPATGRAALDPETASRHPLRILLAEDNVVNQKLALRLLSQMGYRADVAANGLEVLQAVKRQPYDVILMDVQMPEMDGLEATRQLCADYPAGRRPRIIAMTANAMQGDREICLEAGMDNYLSKPIRVEELVAALSQVPSRTGG